MERLVFVLFFSALVVIIHGNKLPKALQEVVERRRRTGDNSHWCCENEMPVEMIQRSRTKVEYVTVSDTIKTGSESCGLIKTCSVYEKVYSHWCCEDDTPVRVIKRSRTRVEHVRVAEKIKTGTKRCRIFFKCSVYEQVYRTEPKFTTEYYGVPHKEACPDEAVKCCKGFLLIVGNCLSLEEISSSGMTIEELIQSKLMTEH